MSVLFKIKPTSSMYKKRNILYTVRGRPCQVKYYTKCLVHYSLASTCICPQNTNLTVSNTFNTKS